MSDRQEFFEESSDHWAESARHDKRQFLSSFVIAASGLLLVGAGIKAVLDGEASGIVGITVGGGVAVAYARNGLDEVQDFADTTALKAVRESQIQQLH